MTQNKYECNGVKDECDEVIWELVGALEKIAVYDLYDCSAVEDTDWQEQCKMMYEIAEQALSRAKALMGEG